MKLYFDNGKNDLRFIAECETEDLCFKEIDNFLKKRNYKSYYMRNWINNDGNKIIDVGSHTEFFEIKY